MVMVRFFAGFKEKVKTDRFEVAVDSKTTLGDFINKLGVSFPEISELLKKKQATIAVNHEIVEVDYLVKEGDEVAIFPPVSGG